ncbi:MAG: glycosyltransferase family 4 protein, partial [Actinomycetota bacterium]
LFDCERSTVARLLRRFERLSTRIADVVVTTNETARRRHINRNRVDPGSITVVRNGPDLDLVREVAPAPAARRDGRTTILYVGSMGRHDGVGELLDAVEVLVTELGRTDAFCVLVGDGAAGDEVRARCRALGPEHAIMTGWLDHTEVPAYLSAADICVAPEPSNEYNDGCTVIKLMEYMALGKPIVAFDLPEHRVTAGEAALYARPNDTRHFAEQLSELMDDEARRHQLGSAARQRVIDQLAWHHQVDDLLAAYQRLG